MGSDLVSRRSCLAIAAAVALVSALAASPAMAADPALTLTTPAALARDNPALPRIAAPAAPATARVNAALARLDAAWRAFLRDCASQPGGAGHAGTTRQVTVAMAGPTVLSVVV